ncbi:MAG: hypothetical protein GXY77_02875, partial [Fibrobacter sp.]|nr:hypothetical protein [Fibrobacter sp.]
LYAKRDTLKNSAEVDVISYEPLVFKTAVVPDIIALGSTDSLVFIVPTERKDTLTCKLLNEDYFSETEISASTESADSVVIVFTPETKGQREFAMLITNGHIKDTLNYEVLVSEKIPVWNITEKAIDAVEGEETSVDLRDFINESFSGDFSLDSDSGEIEDTIWKWTPSWGSAESITAEISASYDSDVYKLELIISVAEGDTTGPTIKLLHSSMDDTIIGSSQITIAAIVTDSQAGVSSVTLNFNSKSSVMTLRDDSIYEGSITELENGQRTKITIVAEDGSMQKNSNEYVFYITYDSTIGDNEAPVITQVSGPENNSRITDVQIPLSFSVTDDSDIDSAYWTLDGIFKGTLAQNGNIYSLFGTLGEYGSNEIEIFAVDKSVNRNHGSLELVFDYNTEITSIDIISPEDDISDVDTSNVTFKWSGGNDEDGDTVFVELLYGTSKTSLNKKITGINCDTLDLTEELKSYTEYFWQVVAYSKVYPDTVKSSIYSFKTEAVPPKIITQPDKNIDIAIGEKVLLRVNATGNPEPSFIWKKDENLLSGEINDSLVIDYVSLTDSGGYTVEVYNEGGTTVSDQIDLRVIYPVKVSAGYFHSLILKNDGSLWACGTNNYGQLGNGKNNMINDDPFEIMNNDVVNMAAGGFYSLILKKDGSLWACGQNSEGQLGNGTNDNENVPVKITNNVANIAAGYNYSLILKNDGSLWACGYNYYGQLGNGTNDDKNTPDSIMNNVANVAAGCNHSLILKTDGTLWVCGDNSYGQLGNGTNKNENTPDSIMDDVANIAAGENHSLILKNDGSLLVCGFNYYGQLGNKSNDDINYPEKIMNDVANVAAKSNHSLILKNDGSLLACGSNFYGQLGNGTNDNINVPDLIMDDVANIAAGSDHSLILKNNGTLWACGFNMLGQLGDGTTENKSTPFRIIPKSTDP